MADDYEASYKTTGTLTPDGAPTSGKFEIYHDEDWFAVNLSADKSYQITMQAAATGGVNATASNHPFALGIGDPSMYGTPSIPWSTAVSANGYLPVMSLAPSESGTYFVAAIGGTGLGSYTLSVISAPKDDYSNSPFAPANLGLYSPVKGAIGVITDVDYFGAALEAGVLYKEVLTPLSGTPQLYGGAIGSYDSFGLSADKMTLSGVLHSAGKYISAVSSENGTGTYSLRLQTVPDDFTSNPSTTGKLALDGSLHGNIDIANDTDWLQVQVVAGQSYRFHVDGAQVFALWSVDGTGKATAEPIGLDDSYSADTSGVRYLEVAGKTAGAYVASMTAIHDDYPNGDNGAPASFAGLSAGSTVSGTLDFEYDMDAFALHALAGHRYRFTYTLTGSDAARVDSDFKWWFGDATAQVTSTDFTTKQAVVTFVAQADTDARMGLTAAHWEVPTGWTLRYEDLGTDDFGPTAATAGHIAVGSVTTARMDGERDIDAFRASVPWGVSYKLSLGGELAAGPDKGTGLVVAMTASGNGAGQLGAQMTTAGAPGQDLVFYVHDNQERTGNYTVALQAVADDYTANPDTAGRIAPGAGASGGFEYLGDRDWFAIGLKANTTYLFGGDANVGGLGVYDATGHLLSDPSLPGFALGHNVSWLGFTPDHDGTYYLQAGSISPGGTTAGSAPYHYTLSAATAKADDHPVTSLVPTGTTITGTIDSQGDTDSFLFDLKAGHQYTFSQSLHHVGDSKFGAPSAVNLSFTNETTGGTATYPQSPGTPYEPSKDERVQVSYSTHGDASLDAYTLTTTDQVPDDYPSSPTAPNAVPGASLHGTIETAGDVDVFRIAVGVNQKLAIVVTGQAHDGFDALDLANLKVSLQYGVAISGSPVYGAAGNAFLVANPAASGDLLVQVAARSGTGGYALQVVDVSGDTTAPVLLSDRSPVLKPDQGLRLHFSEPVGELESGIQPASYKANMFSLSDLTANTELHFSDADTAHVHWEGSDLVFIPDQPWLPGHKYLLQADNWHLTDLAGNTMEFANPFFQIPAAATAPGAGDDVFSGLHDGQRIDGGTGRDMVIYTGTADGQTIQRQADGSFTVTAAGIPTDTLVGVERVLFSGQKDAVALDVAAGAVGGEAYRLYQAAFDRAPDKPGIGFWMNALEHGTSLHEVATGFIGSDEFRQLYGTNPSDADFVHQLYQNVLHRAPDSEGYAYWIDILQHGNARADVLAAFSESAENVAAVAQVIGNGFVYTPYAA